MPPFNSIFFIQKSDAAASLLESRECEGCSAVFFWVKI